MIKENTPKPLPHTVTMSSSSKKIILIIGATGAQGAAVIDGLLKPAADGTSSPYVVRALTRDLSSKRAQALAAKGAELFQGKGRWTCS
jgi:hypothetical protein